MSRQGKIEELKNFVPPLLITSWKSINQLGHLWGTWLLPNEEISPQKLEKLYVSGGLHNRLKIAADASNTYEQFLEKQQDKKYTMAKIKEYRFMPFWESQKNYMSLPLLLNRMYLFWHLIRIERISCPN